MEENKKRTKLTEAESERLVMTYGPLVNSIARSLLRKLPPTVLEEDLIQDGLLGLLLALLQSTKEREGSHFHHYLSQRVRGAMLDGLRESDPGTRRVRREMRRVEVALHELSQSLGRTPLESEVAVALGMPLPAYQHLLMEAHGYTLLLIDDFDDADPGKDYLDWCAKTNSDPLAALERKALHRTLLIALSDLTAQEERVMRFYYVDELTMKEIGLQQGVTEGRISQIHAQAIAKLRAAVMCGEKKPSLLAPRWRLG